MRLSSGYEIMKTHLWILFLMHAPHHIHIDKNHIKWVVGFIFTLIALKIKPRGIHINKTLIDIDRVNIAIVKIHMTD